MMTHQRTNRLKGLALWGALGILGWVVIWGWRTGGVDFEAGTGDLVRVARVVGDRVAPMTGDFGVRRALDWEVADDDLVVAGFGDWWRRYAEAESDDDRARLVAEGEEKARARRDVMLNLIRLDPERALRVTVPWGVRRELPSAVAVWMETPVAGRGELAVLAALPEPGREAEVESEWRTALIDGLEYRAHVFGRRLDQPTRRGIPLHGIALDGELAVSDSPVRRLPPDEAAAVLASAAPATVCLPPDAEPDPIVIQEGAAYKVLCCLDHVEALTDTLVAAESGPPDGADPEGQAEASAWTEGIKKVILIRVDFPDLTGLSLTESGGATLISNLHSFYHEMSYGRTGFTAVGSGSAVTPIFRMSNNASYYGSNNYYNQLRTEARSAATAAGYNLSSYTHDVICMGSVPGFGWAGLGYVGAAGSWLRNSFGTGVAGHELGHNFGLSHAGFWDTAGKSVIGSGSVVEYGDTFDTMGSANAGSSHFNARYKNILNWLQASEMSTATSSGMYRIFAHDQPMTTGPRSLRVAKDSTISYWLEFRQRFTSNRWLMNGVGVRWTGNINQRTQLLDTTPGSSNARTDSALVIGRTLADPASGIYITPVGKGGTTPESLDIMVNLGGFAGNRLPSATVTASSAAVATGTTVTFQVAASDPDGDVLAYYWDFGDGTFGTNDPQVSRSWTTAGEYVVRCTVTDMKGGEASDSFVVRVGSPSTFRISGRVTDGNGPVHGARVFVSSTRMAFSDSDGTYTLTGLPAGTYTAAASLEPHTFAAAGFTNPISVGPNATNIDFSSTTVIPPAITAQPQNQSVAPGATVTFSVAATGTQPMTYQWRFNGAVLAGATSATYTRANVQAADTGNYSVVVSNTAGSATSANAALTVNTPPVILSQPQPQNVLAGATVTFAVNASGTAPLSYQWRRNGTSISGATSSSYTRSNVQLADAGDYSVVVTNNIGSVTSTTARLGIQFGLTLRSTPGGQATAFPALLSYPAGTTVTLTATSTSAYSFTGWSGGHSGTQNPLTLTIQSNLDITAVFASPVADLIVDNPSATFTGNWATATTAANKYGTNYRTVSGSVNSLSATATFTPTIATPGRYDIHIWTPSISKPANSVPVVITHAGGTQTVQLNQSTGTGNWRLLASGVPFNAGTGGSVRLANNVGQGGRSVAADAVCWVYSPTQLASPPVVLAQPADLTVTQNEDAIFEIEAGGSGPLIYQWRFNGDAIEGATESTLVLTAAQPAQEGDYDVVVRNALGEVTSLPAALTVLGPPVFTADPISQAVAVGETARFEAGARGAAPLQFQWRRDDVDLTDDDHFQGVSTPTLTLTNALPRHAGVYTLTVINPLGSATSSMAFLSVGFEGDAFPAPYGDNAVTSHDQNLLAQILTGLADPTGEGVFTRLDSAPRSTFGDGQLSLGDWVQAGRYAAGYDPATPAGGPTSPLAATAATTPSVETASKVEAAASATLRILHAPSLDPATTTVTVELLSDGTIQASAFLLTFDPAVLTFREVTWLDDLAAPQGFVNLDDADQGRLAVIAGRPAPTPFPTGTHPLLQVIFDIIDPVTPGTEVALDTLAGMPTLAAADASDFDATLQSASITLPPVDPPQVTSITLAPDGSVHLAITGTAGQSSVVQASNDLNSWTDLATITTSSSPTTVVDPNITTTNRRFYRLSPVAE